MKKKYFLIILIILLIIFLIYKVKKSDSEVFITKLIHKNTNLKCVHLKDIDKKNIQKNIIIVNNPVMFDKIAYKGEIGLAESYMDGDWDAYDLEYIIYELLQKEPYLVKQIKKQSLNFLFMEIKCYYKSKLPNNTIKSSKKNITSHYDAGNDLFEKMLGKYMQYTCAYFYKDNMTLDEAQYAKIELIAKKLDLKPGMTVLDIGCGFSSMAYHLATNYKVHVIGVTLSKEQKKYADKNFSHKNVKIELKDYRHVKGKFDRVYSVGMFEHVGKRNYSEYYDKCYELLKDDGIMFIHTIGSNIRKLNRNSFINKYIFPEGELPHIENLTGKFIDKWHMEDLQNFGLSYAKTLRAWRKNIGDWSDLDTYNTHFRRMWDFYLLGCAAVFQNKQACLWQIVYTKRNSNRIDNCHHIRN